MAAAPIFTHTDDSSIPIELIEEQCREIRDSSPRGETDARPTSTSLVRVLARKTRLDRKMIREKYKEMYGEDIADAFRSWRRGGDHDGFDAVGDALSMWMADPSERDAVVARRALFGRRCGGGVGNHGHVPNFAAVVEILVGRKSSHVAMIKRAYQARFRRLLEHDILGFEPANPLQKIVIALDASHKAHHVEVSQHIAKCDAKRLYEAGEGGNLESLVLEILSKRSIPQLKLALTHYKKIYGHDYLEKSIKNGTSKEFEEALRSVLKCMCNPPAYYAEALHASLRGGSSRSSEVERVMMSRAEVDMDEIGRFFRAKYGMELRDVICEGIPQGDYRDFLLIITLASATKSS